MPDKRLAEALDAYSAAYATEDNEDWAEQVIRAAEDLAEAVRFHLAMQNDIDYWVGDRPDGEEVK